MAKVTEVKLIDDIDGSEAEHALEFAIDGEVKEIDLSEVHYQEFRGAVDKFWQAGRKPSRSSGAAPAKQARRQRGKTQVGGLNVPLDEIRKWGQENGHPVSDRGRISKAVLEAYQAAH